MAGFAVIDSFSAACLKVFESESHHFQGKHIKKSEGEKLFHYLRRQPITYITFSDIHPSTPNESCGLARTHS